jgi:hypothetical protein
MGPNYYFVRPGDPLPWDSLLAHKKAVTPEFRAFVTNGFVKVPRAQLPPDCPQAYAWLARGKCYSPYQIPHPGPRPKEVTYWTVDEAVSYAIAWVDRGSPYLRYSEDMEVTVLDSIGGDAPPPWQHANHQWTPGNPVSAVQLRGIFTSVQAGQFPKNTIYFTWDATTGEAMGWHDCIE